MLYKTLSGPITCQIEIDNRCNNSCIHCYNHWRHKQEQSNTRMDLSTLERIIDELIRIKVFQVTITGGEPFLNKKILIKAVEMLTSNQIPCAINSNLTLLEHNDAQLLYDLGMRGIMTSFFSFNEEKHDLIAGRKGAFRDTLKGIITATKHNLKVAVSMVLTNINQDDIISTARFLKDYGVTQFFATKASPPVNSINFQQYMISSSKLIQSLDDLLYLEKNENMDVGILECYPLCSYLGRKYHFAIKRSCSAGITTCTIGVEGDIRPCSHSEESFGNINLERLDTIWMKMKKMREKSILPNECISCNYLQDCTGGCRVDSKYCYGKINSLDPYACPDNVGLITLNEEILQRPRIKDYFILNPNRIERNEEEGILIAPIDNPGEPAFITHDTFELLLDFKNPFSPEIFAREANLSVDDSIEILAMLQKDNIIIPA